MKISVPFYQLIIHMTNTSVIINNQSLYTLLIFNKFLR